MCNRILFIYIYILCFARGYDRFTTERYREVRRRSSNGRERQNENLLLSHVAFGWRKSDENRRLIIITIGRPRACHRHCARYRVRYSVCGCSAREDRERYILRRGDVQAQCIPFFFSGGIAGISTETVRGKAEKGIHIYIYYVDERVRIYIEFGQDVSSGCRKRRKSCGFWLGTICVYVCADRWRNKRIIYIRYYYIERAFFLLYIISLTHIHRSFRIQQ